MDAAALPMVLGVPGADGGVSPPERGQQDALSRAPQRAVSWGKISPECCLCRQGLGVQGKGRAGGTNSGVTSLWGAGLRSPVPAASQPSEMGKSQPPPCAHRQKGTISAAAAPRPQEQA